MNTIFLILSLVVPDSNSFIRTNQVGYLPDAPKFAVICSLDFIVYHDDLGDYSTNEPIMDGTANLSYLFAAMAATLELS